MKQKIINAIINGVIGVLTSVATIYLGASAAEAVTASGVAAGTLGGRAADVVATLFG